MKKAYLGLATVGILALVVILVGYFYIGPTFFTPKEPSATSAPRQTISSPSITTKSPTSPGETESPTTTTTPDLPAIEVSSEYSGKTNPYWGDAAAISEGEVLYSNCVSCHAETGIGIGLPGQPDFTNLNYWENRADDELLYITSEGRAAMPAWKAQMTEDEIWKVLAYSKSFGKEAPAVDGGAEEEAEEPEVVPIGRWEERDDRGLIVGSAAYFGGDASLGESIYASQCALCHGEDGDGKGPAAKGLEPAVADFSNEAWMQRERDVHFFYSIMKGVEQSDMPAFEDRLSEEDVWDVIAYIREFTGEEGKSAKVLIVDRNIQYIGETSPDDINCLGCHDYVQHKRFHTAAEIMKIDELRGKRRRICIDCHGPLGPPWDADKQLTEESDLEYDPEPGLNGVFKMPNKVPHNIHLEMINDGSLQCQYCHLRDDQLYVPEAKVEIGQVLNCENCGHHPEGANFWTVHIEMNGLPCTTCHTEGVQVIHGQATTRLGQLPEDYVYQKGLLEETTTETNSSLQ
ncbi:MAG: cytochrome c [Candidatus Hydrothermarchaeales archaeon]